MKPRCLVPCLLLLAGCGDDPTVTSPAPAGTVVVTFNTGTSEKMGHDGLPDDGYGSEQAALSDQWYGDGLAWASVVEDARQFFQGVDADIVGFQEIFYSGDCEIIPAEARHGGPLSSSRSSSTWGSATASRPPMGTAI